MPANMVLLEKITVGAAGASSVTFSGIPQTGYTDLVVKASPRSDRANVKDTIDLKFNGTGTGLTEKYLQGNGSVATSGSLTNYYGEINAASSSANIFSNLEIYIPNYASANYKSFSIDIVMEDNATLAIAELFAGLWSNTAAINSITLSIVNGTIFTQYSTFYLYGVAAYGTTPAISPYATGGSTIMTDGTYWYHAFKSSGTFTPIKALTAEILVVAGGGGGGYDRGGGAGAGGVCYHANKSLSSLTNYTAEVGAGGNIQTSYGQTTNGTDSTFFDITANAGASGPTGNNNGSVGGSGSGGAGNASYGTSNQGTSGGATGYGNSGGAGVGGSTNGGGGGAGSAGANGVSGQSGAGGAGLNTWSTWATATSSGASGFFAGGGGGGAYRDSSPQAAAGSGGAGGGGAGGSGSAGAGTAGTANTGGGGGGGANINQGNGGAGGSGIVIVRYSV